LRRKEKLRSTTLTVAVLVPFIIGLFLTLPGLFGIVLSRLAGLLALSVLSGLTTLLTFLLHIVCHKNPPKKAWAVPRLSEFVAINN
jgi:fluoride ion exporter CrcB/FEX